MKHHMLINLNFYVPVNHIISKFRKLPKVALTFRYTSLNMVWGSGFEGNTHGTNPPATVLYLINFS